MSFPSILVCLHCSFGIVVTLVYARKNVIERQTQTFTYCQEIASVPFPLSLVLTFGRNKSPLKIDAEV